ncbi:hypothetical protein DFH06DRAFT_102561 [Mycena polygramma]|nr:hypothetical protein DFH06DRAFT_102561 [Mycena polygramma]
MAHGILHLLPCIIARRPTYARRELSLATRRDNKSMIIILCLPRAIATPCSDSSRMGIAKFLLGFLFRLIHPEISYYHQLF